MIIHHNQDLDHETNNILNNQEMRNMIHIMVINQLKIIIEMIDIKIQSQLIKKKII
jgi:hypothetical protein